MFQLMHSSGDKEDWLVRENVTEEVLHTFPCSVSDKLMFAIMHFAREYELKAFNAGIQFAKQQNLSSSEPTPIPYN
jgi:hypothetical protein